MRWRALGVAAAAAAAAGPPARVLPVGDSNHTIMHQGRDRTFQAFVPSSEKPTGLMVFLHGGGRTQGFCCDRVEARRYAREFGYVAVCPQGVDNRWNAFAEDSGVDDVGFLREVVRYVHAGALIPHGRTFFGGISNGGLMSYRLACEAPEVVDGIGPVASAYLPGVYRCDPAHPRPVWQGNGDLDLVAPIDAALRDWRVYSTEVLACTPESEHVVYRHGDVHCTGFSHCPAASHPSTSVWCTYVGMGHVYPDEGEHDWGLAATPTMWRFLIGQWPPGGSNSSGAA